MAQMAPHAGTLARSLYDYILYSIRYMDLSDICGGVAEIAEDIVNERDAQIRDLENENRSLQENIAELESRIMSINSRGHADWPGRRF